MKIKLISIILPVHNQADHLVSVLKEYQRDLKKFGVKYELILVENGSRDNSLALIKKIANKNPQVKVLVSQHAGWGVAVKTGLKAATGDLICYSNLARTSSQDLMLILLYATFNPGVVIKANRKIRDSLFRRMGSLLFNLQSRALFDLAHWDINGTPKCFPRFFKSLRQLQQNDDLIDLEFSVICRRHNYPILEVPIFSSKRHGGSATTNMWSAVKIYLGAFRLKRKFG